MLQGFDRSHSTGLQPLCSVSSVTITCVGEQLCGITWVMVTSLAGVATVGSVLPDQGVEGVLHGPGLDQRLPAALHCGLGRVVEQAS